MTASDTYSHGRLRSQSTTYTNREARFNITGLSQGLQLVKLPRSLSSFMLNLLGQKFGLKQYFTSPALLFEILLTRFMMYDERLTQHL